MKSCPVCHSTYPRDFTLCPRDGTKLVEVGVWSEGTLVRGKYRIIGKIGEGGMATVFKAMHVRFEELRALKVISSELSSDSSFIKRLQQEAVITRRLQHPNAVRVEDIDEAEDGRPFIVMEYIEGRSLKDVIEEAPLPVERTCRIVKQVAAALDAAHALGILHRDIKPANIVLIQTPEGEQAKVLDFGIAKVKEANLGETAEMTLTGKGRVVGTSAYMSPEQAMGMRGEELDGRSDLYSLGVVMYQMLVGELPLKAESEVTMLIAHMQTAPKPIKLLRPDLPDFVADLVMRLLEKKRELRPASGRALIEEIEGWERAVSQPAVVAAPEPEHTILYREAYKEPSTIAASAEGGAEAVAEEGTRRLGSFPGEPAPLTTPATPLWPEAEAAAQPSAPSSTSKSFPAVEATMLASGFGARPESSPPATPASNPEEPHPGGEATILAAGFGASQEGSPPPPPAPTPGTPSAEQAYPPGEATMLASSLAGKPEGEPASERGSSTASRLASGASVWDSASAVAAQQRAETASVPPATPGWGDEAQGAPAVPPVDDQQPARKSSWALWAAVPLVAIAITAGAWYLLTHGVGSPPSSTPASPSPGTTTPNPPADSGPSQPAGAQPSGQPASGSTAPGTTAAPVGSEGGAPGAGAKPEETKPAETKGAENRSSETKAESKAIDRRAVQALKTEGDQDYEQGLYDDAIRAYRKALKLDPGSKVLVQQIARVKKAQETERNLLK